MIAFALAPRLATDVNPTCAPIRLSELLCSALQDSGAPLRWPDLRVGSAVTLYKRTYYIVSADAGTRAFYAERGQEQPPDEALPEGPFDQRRKVRVCVKVLSCGGYERGGA